MNSTTKTTIGVFDTHSEAEAAIIELRATGVMDKDISYMYSDNKGDVKDGQTGEKVSTGAVGGASTGAVIGALAGLAVANGILPGIGTLFVGGPIAAALGLSGAVATTAAGAATGAAAGGLLGALTGYGVSAADAKNYEDLVRKGDVLVIVKSDSDITDVFNKTNAIQVKEYSA